MELNEAIKVVLKTKVGSNKPKQLKAIKILTDNGYEVLDSDFSSYDYYSVKHNNRMLTISQINHSNKSGVFIDSSEIKTLTGDRLLNTGANGDHVKISNYFDKIDYVDVLNKHKYSQAGRIETKVDRYIYEHNLNFTAGKLFSDITIYF